MIAKNYMKHPEALRFQRELFSNGFHNSPRIMRLMECIFDWTPAAPAWWTAAKARARALAKTVKKSIADFFKGMTVKAADQLSLVFEASAPPILDMLLKTAKHPHTDYLRTVDLNPYWCEVNEELTLQAQGEYRRFCPETTHTRLWARYPAAEA